MNISDLFTTYRITLKDDSVLETKIPSKKTFQSAVSHMNPKQEVIRVQWYDARLGDWLNVLPSAVRKFEKKRRSLTNKPRAKSKNA